MNAFDFETQRGTFLESLRVRHQAAATVRTRGQSLAVLGAFLAGIGVADVREVTREHVAAFQRWLAAKAYTGHTRQVHLATLRTFFAHLERTDTILVNPCAGLVVPRLAERLPKGVLTREEARRILDAPDVQTRTGLRDKAILEVFYSTGLRLAELTRLTIFDVDPKHGFVRVTNGKGGKDRIVPLGTKAGGCVREYLAQARAHWSQENPAERTLWLGSIAPHGALKAQAIQVMVRQYGQAVGVRVTPHLWRHTCATHLVSNGANLVAVQRLLGHASLATTQLYARVTLAEIKTAYHRAHPPVQSMTFADAIAQHLDALRVRNYAPGTLINRAYQLRFLSGFLAQQRPPVQEIETVTGEILVAFQSWLYHRPTPQGTARGVANQNRILTGVRGFFAFLKTGGWLTHDPAAALAQAREPRRLPRHVLTPQEARRILESVDTGTVRGYRDRTILEVFYATGIRKAELLSLRVADVNLEEELLRIERGKGGRDRVVPLSRIACRFLETYLNAIRPELVKNGRRTDQLFLSHCGRPLDKNSLSELVTHYARAAGIKKHVTAHIWRHTCATHLLKNRANLRHVQEILGHRSLATTERYLHLTITDLKEAHRRCHPREKGVA